MAKVVLRYSRYYVKRPEPLWSKLTSWALLIGWFVIVLGNPFRMSLDSALWTTLVMFGGIIVVASIGTRHRLSKLTAVLEARQVAGGVLLTVMDEHNRRVEVVVSEAKAQDLATMLTGRTGHTGATGRTGIDA